MAGVVGERSVIRAFPVGLRCALLCIDTKVMQKLPTRTLVIRILLVTALLGPLLAVKAIEWRSSSVSTRAYMHNPIRKQPLLVELLPDTILILHLPSTHSSGFKLSRLPASSPRTLESRNYLRHTSLSDYEFSWSYVTLAFAAISLIIFLIGLRFMRRPSSATLPATE